MTPTPTPYLAAVPDFAAGTDNPRAFLERCLERLGAFEPEIGAFVWLDPSAARAAADRSAERWRAGRRLSPIDGMPLGIKDIIETADMPTQMGSDLYAGWRSGRDAASVAALRQAGAVILGKTVTTEFAASEPRGTRNPWDPRRTPGGSSSGSAAAVACGIVPAALGTQVVGSTIRPASYCGVTGFKPSIGALNRGGSLDLLSQSCTGVLAAALDDAWAVAYAIASRVGGDPGCRGLAGPAEPAAARQPRAIAVLETAGWAAAAPAARQALDAALARIAAAGVAIRRRNADADLDAVERAIAPAFDLTRGINAWEWRWPLAILRDRDAAKLSRAMLDRLATAEAMSLDDYRRLLDERGRIRRLYATLSATVEASVTLAATGAAPIGLGSTGDPAFAVPASLLGVPALSLPLLTDDGLPLGLQVIGFSGGDADLFGVAGWLRRLLGRP